jgi:hypothetical protein
MPFATLFSNVASRLFGAAPAGAAGAVEPELVQLAVEAIVDAVDPRLRSLSRYQSRIAPGAERTIAFVRCPRSELPPKEDLIARAAKELL